MRPTDWTWPLLAGIVAAGLWWTLAVVERLPSLEASVPPGVFDFLAYYRPNAHYAFARLAAGDLPLWNPQQGFGMPFLATLQTGVFYPPNALHLVLPVQLAFAVLAAVHLGIAAALACAFSRALGASGWGAVAAGLLYGGSSWLLGSPWSPPTLYSAAWLPGVLLAVDRIVERPDPRRAAALAVVVAMQSLTGWPYVLLMTALAAAIFAVGALTEVALRERRVPTARIAALAAGAIGGILLAAPQLLPAAELVAQSSRELGALEQEQTVLLTAQHDPGRFLSTIAAGGPSDGVPGALALPLALLAVVRRGPLRTRLAILLGVGAFGLAVSFPLHVPVYGWLRELPLAGDFRFPFRYRLLSTLALAVAAGVGVTQAASLIKGTLRTQHVAAGALAALVVAAQSVTTQPATIAFPKQAAWLRPSNIASILEEISKRSAAEGRIHWQHGEELHWIDKIGQMEGLRFTHDLEPLTPAATARYLNFLETGVAGTLDARDLKRRLPGGAPSPALRPSGFLGTIPFFGRVGLAGDPSRSQLFDLASVRFVLAYERPGWLEERFARIDDLGSRPAVFENTAALPRAYRANRAEAEPGTPDEALARLAAKEFDARSTVLVDADAAERIDAAQRATTAPDAGRAVFERDDPERQVIRTWGERPAVVVVTDAFFPGWRATVDGSPATLLRVNTVFRGVAVPAGEHVVELRYQPESLRIGVVVSLATLAAFVACVAAPWRWRSRGVR